MRRPILLASLLGLAGLASAVQAQVTPPVQSCETPDPSSGLGVVMGVVREATTQVPMGFVEIRLIPEDPELPVRLARSDPSGRFFFCEVPAGIYSVQGWFDQLGGNLTQVMVGAGRTVPMVLGFALSQESNEPGSLSGQLIDADTRQPVEAALVELPDINREILTNAEGRFSFPSIRPGTYRLRANHLGYQDAAGSVAVGGAQAVTIEILMATRVLALDPITVTATRQEIHSLPGMEYIRARMQSGNGEFVFPGENDRWVPSKTTDLLQGTGVTVMNNGTAIYMRRSSCAPVVYIDDIRITHGQGSRSLQQPTRTDPSGMEATTLGGSRESDIDEGNFAALAVNMIPPSDIQAIEIYHGPADTPGQYLDSSSQCGVILIWTRRGPRGG